MSERLHPTPNDQMHWRFCLFFKGLKAQQLSVDAGKIMLTVHQKRDVRKAAFDLERSNALAILFVFRKVKNLMIVC